MKVVLVSHSSAVENLGGAEASLLDMIDHWRRRSPEVEFLVVARGPSGLLQPELESRGVRHELLDFDAWVLPEVRRGAEQILDAAVIDSRAVVAITGLLREFAPDVVVTNTIISPWAAIAAKHLGIPHVWMVREYGDLDHGLDFRLGRDATFEDIDLLSDLVIANSEAVRDHVSRWVPEDRLTVAYPAVQVDRTAAPEAAGPKMFPDLDGALKVAMVGRLSRSKGQWRLLRAVALLRDEGIPISVTLIGGSGTLEAAEILDLIEELDLHDRVSVTGESANPLGLIAQADVGVTASDHEAFGRVTAEYLALGKPVIASGTGGSPELVNDGVSGWLFDPGNVNELVVALREAYGDREGLRRRGEAARNAFEEISSRHPLDHVIARIESLVGRGARAIPRLPNLTRFSLELPPAVDAYAAQRWQFQHEIVTSRSWRAGSRLAWLKRFQLRRSR